MVSLTQQQRQDLEALASQHGMRLLVTKDQVGRRKKA
jgi:hypothetical protein